VLALDPQPQHLLIDARRLDGMAMPQQPIIKGDAKSITIGPPASSPRCSATG